MFIVRSATAMDRNALRDRQTPLMVTGLTGFVGRALQENLDTGQFLLMQLPPKFDLMRADSVAASLAGQVPDYVIHLAAQSFVPESFTNPRHTFEVNLFGLLNLLEGLKAAGFGGRMLLVSTGDVYGEVGNGQLITEELSPHPRNPYAVSKLAAEALALQWGYTDALDIVIARPFNHIGPGQNERFVVSNFARQIIEIKLAQREPVLKVGDIDVARDFTDVLDVIDAYFTLLNQGVTGEIYNVASAQSYRIRDLIERMLALAGVKADIVQEASRLRQSEQREVRASCTKLRQATGWKPSISIDESLRKILTYWESELHG